MMQKPVNEQSEGKGPGADMSQEPAEGDRATIDRELARKDGGNVAHEETETVHDKAKSSAPDIHDKVKAAMDEAAPQTGVRPGP